MKENYEFAYAELEDEERKEKLLSLLKELEEVLLERSDGIGITITRSKDFPKHKDKYLIEEFKVNIWDHAA